MDIIDEETMRVIREGGQRTKRRIELIMDAALYHRVRVAAARREVSMNRFGLEALATLAAAVEKEDEGEGGETTPDR